MERVRPGRGGEVSEGEVARDDVELVGGGRGVGDAAGAGGVCEGVQELGGRVGTRGYFVDFWEGVDGGEDGAGWSQGEVFDFGAEGEVLAGFDEETLDGGWQKEGHAPEAERGRRHLVGFGGFHERFPGKSTEIQVGAGTLDFIIQR